MPAKIRILILVAVIVVAAGITAYIKFSPTPTTDDKYKLTHSATDVDYILSWDEIVSQCPDIGAYDKQETFSRRGETNQSGTGGTTPLEVDSPAAWASYRFVFAQAAPTASQFRGFAVFIMYFDTAEYLDEYMNSTQMSGLCFEEEGDFVISVLEGGPPTQSVQLHIAGNQFYILIVESASSGESLFFSKEELMELLPGVKSNISSLEITALPPAIPDRIVVEDTYEWHEFMTFRSEELSPPIRVPEEGFYNDLWFVDWPSMQVFNFTIDKDWRFVMTATGEVGTKSEVYVTVTSSGEEGFSYSSDHPFSLCRETITLTREQPLEDRYEPPIDIEIKVFFDSPISWVITVEK